MSPHTIIAPFTSKIKNKLLPCHVVFPAEDKGLSLDSVLLTEQVRVIDKSRLEHKIGTISKEKLVEVENAFRIIMGCDFLHLMGRTMKTFSAHVEWNPETKLCTGVVPGISGAHSQGATLDELHDNLKEVLEMCKEV